MMLAIAWTYLTGRAVATDPTNRQVAEWPPHPDRVFQALVAAWGEHGCGPAGNTALVWLEGLAPPCLCTPAEELAPSGAAPKTFVPVNDLDISVADVADFDKKVRQAADKARKNSKDPEAAAAKRAAEMVLSGLNMLPSRPQGRAERFFPSTLPGDACCALIWPDASPTPDQRAVLAELCTRVTAIGHSRSLVRVWLSDDPPPPTWEPACDGRRDISLRVAGPGRLDGLVAAFAAGRRPGTSGWQPYRRASAPSSMVGGPFDPRLIILRRCGGAALVLTSILAWSEALRGTLIKAADGLPDLLPLISGHASGGAAMEEPHLAYLPLPDVGHRHADGHLLGLAIALPSHLPGDTESRLFRLIAGTLQEETGSLTLTAGRSGACDLVIEDRPVPPYALRAGTWSSAATEWATVTPITLDRLPPRRHRPTGQALREVARKASEEHDAFAGWVSGQIADACARQGLPTPSAIELMPVSHWTGAPPAKAFPPLLRRADGAKRWHTHARLTFPCPVRGPLLLGAGRFRGYGLCRPLGDA